MKKILIAIVVLVGLYFVGPHPDAPTFPGPSWNDIPNEPQAITAFLQAKEAENEKLEAKAETAQQKLNNIRIFVGCIILLFLSLSIFTYYYYKYIVKSNLHNKPTSSQKH